MILTAACSCSESAEKKVETTAKPIPTTSAATEKATETTQPETKKEKETKKPTEKPTEKKEKKPKKPSRRLCLRPREKQDLIRMLP